MPLSYDLTPFQFLGQKLSNFFVGILVQMMTLKGHFEINWPLANYRMQYGKKKWKIFEVISPCVQVTSLAQFIMTLPC